MASSTTRTTQPSESAPKAPETDSRRIREVHRFYEPFQTPSTTSAPADTFIHTNALSNHTPTSSHDKALTAFCQLTAIRLRAQRALLIFFGVKRGYVLAEATQSLSLQRDARCNDGDDLWLGHCTIPEGFTVCENTHASASCNPPKHPFDTNVEVDVVADLHKDKRYSDSSYVTGYPAARFYAGVPIAPRDVNVGVLCVLDDQPRDRMTDDEITFMTDMSSTIAEHLETMRARLEYRRATQMVSGMSEFIEAASGRTNDLNAEVFNDPVSRKIDLSLRRSPRASVDSNLQPEAAIKDSSKHQEAPISPPEDDVTRPAFQTAASIIQRALDVDVYFLDASAATFEALVDRPENDFRVAGPAGSASGTADEKEIASIPIPHESGKRSEDLPTCRVLGSALKADSRRPSSAQGISPQFLRTLLRRYHRGKTWTFDEDGIQIMTDVSSADSDLSTGSGSSQSQLRTTTAQSRSERKRRHRVDDATTLNTLFPGARSLALVPMWNHATEKWLAGAVLVTHSPLRTFSNSDELNYITAFCDVILANAARRDVEATLHNKMAFTSSITHELRTPLHGILGTVEHLYEEVQSAVAAKMVSQIELCGKTLLDVIDHVLDFSEVNQYSSAQEALDPLSDGHQSRLSSVTPTMAGRWLPGSQSRLTDAPLDAATEQVIDAITYSHLSTFDHRRLREYRVSTIIAIDHAIDKRWQCRFPVSAWKRVCMNLVGNALKYTSEGYIYVTLKQKNADKKGTRRQVVFSVQDTGKGMSQAFMADSLFQAFAQESSFSEGAGLGMNVVAKIVRAMGGKIDVQSSPGKGTIVTVVVPVDSSPSSVIEQPAVSFQELQHVSVRLLGDWDLDVHTKADRGRKLLRDTVKTHLEELGVTVRPHTRKQGTESINLIFEADMLAFFSQLNQLEQDDDIDGVEDLVSRPVVIICETYHSSRRVEKSIGAPGTIIHAHVEYLIEPCGPHRLVSALRSCLPSSKTKQLPRRPLFKSRLSSSEWKIPTSETQASSSSDRGNETVSTAIDPTVSSSGKGSRQESPNGTSRFDTSGTSVDNPRAALSVIHPIMQRLVQIRADARKPPPPPPPPPQLLTIPNKNRSLDILIVDDNEVNVQLLQMYCQKQGHRSQTAADGQQAVDSYTGSLLADLDGSLSAKYSISGGNIERLVGCPQVVLMDINMPIMDGFEASRQIRALEKKWAKLARRALIVAMTGLGSADVRQRAFASGIDLFFQKPVKLRDLTNALEERFPVDAG